jgi:ribosomal protein S18 acetylase RimI-like enzyme
MTPPLFPAFPPAENQAVKVVVRSIFPPQKIEHAVAARIAEFLDPAAPLDWLSANLAKEPREPNSFALVAEIDSTAVGYLRLQHGRKATATMPGLCWIRELAIEPLHRRRGIGSRLIREAADTVHPHELLTVEVRETETWQQLFLSAAGLECLPPWRRTRRQRDRRLYEFRSVCPTAKPWQGRARFTWPPIGA